MGGSPSCYFYARAPGVDERQALLARIIKRIMKQLTRTGYLIEEQGVSCLAEADSDSALTPLQAAACTYRKRSGLLDAAASTPCDRKPLRVDRNKKKPPHGGLSLMH